MSATPKWNLSIIIANLAFTPQCGTVATFTGLVQVSEVKKNTAGTTYPISPDGFQSLFHLYPRQIGEERDSVSDIGLRHHPPPVGSEVGLSVR